MVDKLLYAHRKYRSLRQLDNSVWYVEKKTHAEFQYPNKNKKL